MAGRGQGLGAIKPRTLRSILVRLALVLLALSGLGLSACSPPKFEPKTRKELSKKIRKKILKKIPKITVEEPNISEFDQGVKRWELWGDRIETVPGEKEAVFKTVKVDFFEEGRTSLKVQALQARYKAETRRLYMDGPITAYWTREKVTMKAPALVYDQKTKQVSSTGAVTLDGPTSHLRGDGVVADVAGRLVHLKKGVVLKMELPRKKGPSRLSTRF